MFVNSSGIGMYQCAVNLIAFYSLPDINIILKVCFQDLTIYYYCNFMFVNSSGIGMYQCQCAVTFPVHYMLDYFILVLALVAGTILSVHFIAYIFEKLKLK